MTSWGLIIVLRSWSLWSKRWGMILVTQCSNSWHIMSVCDLDPLHRSSEAAFSWRSSNFYFLPLPPIENAYSESRHAAHSKQFLSSSVHRGTRGVGGIGRGSGCERMKLVLLNNLLHLIHTPSLLLQTHCADKWQTEGYSSFPLDGELSILVLDEILPYRHWGYAWRYGSCCA